VPFAAQPLEGEEIHLILIGPEQITREQRDQARTDLGS
jgi:hypothetical protein